jgi:protoporphyrinogen oxidase
MRERFVPYPFQLNIHRLPDAEQAACLRGLVTAARRAVTEQAPPGSFGDWIDRAFGSGIGEIFLRPYNWKVWAYPLEELAWHWTGDRVATVDLPRVVANIAANRDDVSWGPNNQFRFPARGGTGAVWRTLADRLARRHPDRFAYGTQVTHVDTARRRVTTGSGEALDDLARASDLSDTLKPSVADLKYSSTHVIGVGLFGRPPPSLDGKCWMYFPESDCPFYRVTVFSHYSPNNVPDIGRYWSLMAEVAESPAKPVDASRVVADTIDGMLATGLVPSRASVHHTWHRRLEHGYPTPSRDRDRGLAAAQSLLESRRVFSRGRFGAWKYEVSNQDHSFAQGVECADRLLGGARSEEETLNRPDLVNGRRSSPRRLAVGGR